MKNLRNILLAGSLHLVGCSEKGLLTEKDFREADWMAIPFTGEIWTSYMGENIRKNDANWQIYQEQVAKINGFSYATREDGRKIIKDYIGKWIYVPDLDKNGSVSSKEIKQIAKK